MMTKPPPSKTELLAPAGNFEKLEIAIHFGADAVYLGGKDFSLRSFSGNFTPEDMQKAIRYAHDRGVKVYVTCNIYPRNNDISAITDYLIQLGKIGVDAIIVSDPGILSIALERIPHVPIHLSTQANTTNFASVSFWEKMKIRRINLARELSLKEITEIAQRCRIECEIFVHGAMCISYSGRCLLSSFLANRESNRGMCCQPCRSRYAVIEESRPQEHIPIAEDRYGTYIFNSKDLCMIRHIPEMISTGATAFKIEGRMKTVHYLATVVKTYREAVDRWYDNPQTYSSRQQWLEELEKINHRGYCTGFFFGHSPETDPNFYESVYRPTNIIFAGKVIEHRSNGLSRVDIRNKTCIGDTIEILKPSGFSPRMTIKSLYNPNGVSIPAAQPGQIADIPLEVETAPNDIIRKRMDGTPS